jgi:hypothetical protein
MHWTKEEKPCLRGEPVPEIPHDDSDDDFPAAADSDGAAGEQFGIGIELQHTEAAAALLGQDILMTQQSQTAAAERLTQSLENKDQIAVGKLRDTLKLVEGNPAGWEWLNRTLDNMHHQALSEMSDGGNRFNSKPPEAAAAAPDTDTERLPESGLDDVADTLALADMSLVDESYEEGAEEGDSSEGITFVETGHSKHHKTRIKGAAI